MVTILGLPTLINGTLNNVLGPAVTVVIILGIFVFGASYAPVTALPAVPRVSQVLYAVALLDNPPRPVRPSKTIAILAICAFLAGNIGSTAVGIFELVFYSDPVVKRYFDGINSPAT
jgi:hypothetical protein